MAYIRKRGKTWGYTVELSRNPVTGERDQDTKSGFKTKREAEIAAAKIEVDVANGTFVKESNTTFEQFTDTWLKLYRTSGKKNGSIRQRTYQIMSLKKYFAKVKLRNITRKSYQDAILDMSSKMARNTVVGIHGVAQMIFHKAREFDEIKLDPSEFARVPVAPDTGESDLPKYMEKDQLVEFLRLAKHRGLDDDYLIFLILAYTGIRIGEVCVLKWTDIDFTLNTISINGTLDNPDDVSTMYVVGSPKTKSARREIDVDPKIIAELDKHRTKQNEFKMSKRMTYHDAGFIFGRTDDAYGYPPKRRTVERRMDRLIQWMTLPQRLTPHSLRHTHTSLLAEAGVSLEAIMKRLGHKNDATTRLVYLHVTKTVQLEASQKFSALMSDVVKL